MTTATGTYTIEQAAERTGLSRHTLRYYERIGLLAPVGRAASGHRAYDDADLASIRFLTLLRETGMPIRDMQRFVELTRAGADTVPQRLDVLEAHRKELREHLARLGEHLHAIDRKIGVYRSMLAERTRTPEQYGAAPPALDVRLDEEVLAGLEAAGA